MFTQPHDVGCGARPLDGGPPRAARTGSPVNPDGRGRDQDLASRFGSARVHVTSTYLVLLGSRGPGTHACARLLGATCVHTRRSPLPRPRTGGRGAAPLGRPAAGLLGRHLPWQGPECPGALSFMPTLPRVPLWSPAHREAADVAPGSSQPCTHPPPRLGTPTPEPSPQGGRGCGPGSSLAAVPRVSVLAQPWPGSQMVAAAGREEPDTPFQTDFTAGLWRAPRAPDNPICCE